MVDLLRDCGVLDVSSRDEKGRTPLHVASQFGVLSSVLSLLSSGADVRAVDCESHSSLMLACDRGHVAVVRELLLALDGDIGPHPLGFTTMHVAAQLGLVDVMARCVSSGVSVDVRTSSGLTPLHVSAQSGSESSVRWLLQSGARPWLLDGLGRSALSLVSARGGVLWSLLRRSGELSGEMSVEVFRGDREVDVELEWSGVMSSQSELNGVGVSSSSLSEVRLLACCLMVASG
jgi:hypothetical protein